MTLPQDEWLPVLLCQVVQAAEEDHQVFQQAGRHRLHHHTHKDIHVVVAMLLRCVCVRPVLQNAVRVNDELGEGRMERHVVAQSAESIHQIHIALVQLRAVRLIHMSCQRMCSHLPRTSPDVTAGTCELICIFTCSNSPVLSPMT